MRRNRRTDDAREFEDFAASAEQRLYRQAYLLTGDRQSAQDLVQEALVAVLLAWRRVDSPHAYAQRCLVHAFLGQARRADRGRQLVALTHWARPVESPRPTETVDDRVALMDALATLAPRMRTTVVLRYWEDLSVEQTAVAMGCSEGTVKSTSSKALAHLRTALGDTFSGRASTTHGRTS